MQRVALRRRHELLADQHARLWRAFDAWKRSAQSGNARKQVIDAACVVGARFAQRRFFQRWRERAAQQKAASRAVRNSKPLAGVVVASRLRAHQLRVVGAAIPRPPVGATARLADQRSDRAARASALQRLLSACEQRRLFRRWRFAAAALRRELEQTALAAAQVLRFRVRQLLARWKRRAVATCERSQLEQRAHFFLYFCLTKRSLEQLARHAAASQRSRAVAAIAARGSQRRALRRMLALCAQWRLLRSVCAAWHVHVAAKTRASDDPATEAARLLVGTKARARLLQKAFAAWRDALVRRQLLARLARAAQQLRERAVRAAWRRWQQLVVQAATVERWQDDRDERVQRQVWRVWRLLAARASAKERDRRRAVRFAYHRSLRRVFDGFVVATQQARAAAESADELASGRAKRVLARCFLEWVAVAARRRDTARTQVAADRLYARALARRVWTRGWRSHVATRTTARANAERALRHLRLQLQRRAFAAWRTEWTEQKTRNEALEATAARHLAARSEDRTARVVRAWLEYVRGRQARRIVSAHVRGEWQVKELRARFADWRAGVSAIRWQQIQSLRAQQQHATTLARRCVAFWRAKVAACTQFRAQNRVALGHWKLAVERKAFEGIKAFVATQRAQRVRMRDALEFRRRLLVRDGVRHWVAAALHLQSEREDLVSQCHAERAARTWRTVARIARHWRSVAIRRRAVTSGTRATPVERAAGGLDCSWGLLRLDPTPPVGRYRSPPAPAPGKENRGAGNVADPTPRAVATTRSGLSEFVTHPAMNRPQPRRPIALLLEDAYAASQQHASAASSPPDAAANVSDLHARYGLSFPAPPFAPLAFAAPPTREAHAALPHRTPALHAEADNTAPTAHSSTLAQLDTLETQLRTWAARKQHLKTLEDQIRAHREQLAAPRCVHPPCLPVSLTVCLPLTAARG